MRHARVIVPALCSALAALVPAGCASPAKRIQRNPELFNSFPAQVQERVRRGEVDIGFNRDMVLMALGKPDRVYQRTAESGQAEIWSYVSQRLDPGHSMAYSTWRFYDGRGYRTICEPVWFDIDRYYEYEKLRVEFVDGVVKAVERILP